MEQMERMLLAVQWTSGWAGTQPDMGMPCLTARETEDEYCFFCGHFKGDLTTS